jgi:signal transduction histidine kinase
MMVDLVELLDGICLRFADRAEQQGVTLRCHGTPGEATFASVDIELFERALANLVDNALRFTPAAGRITLQAEAHDERIEVSVSDTGAGIAAHDLDHLFDRLYTSGARAASGEGGRGLGLAIVKRIVELHQGQVAVRSDSGHGTTVTIGLPRR